MASSSATIQAPAADNIQQAWLDAIQTSLQVLHAQQPQQQHENPSYHNNANGNRFQPRPPPPRKSPMGVRLIEDEHKIEEVSSSSFSGTGIHNNRMTWEQSLADLGVLEHVLLERHYSDNTTANGGGVMMLTLDQAPVEYPPSLSHNNNHNNNANSNKNNRQQAKNQAKKEPHVNVKREEVEDEEDDEAGDVLLLEPPPTTQRVSAPVAQVYTARRLLVRIHTGQAELLLGYGRYQELNYNHNNNHNNNASQQLNKIHAWMAVSHLATQAFERGQAALVLADMAVAQWYEMTSHNMATAPFSHPQQQQQHAALVQDADIVAVALQWLVTQQEAFVQKVQREKARLKNRLRPQWQARDDAKRRMGVEAWQNNANPNKGHFAKRREADEAALELVNQVLQQLPQGVEGLLQTVGHLQQKLGVGGNNTISSFGSVWANGDHNNNTTMAEHEQRHNGQRPSRTLYQRVSWHEYPDPTDYGWTFTGCFEEDPDASPTPTCVEFFEQALPDARDAQPPQDNPQHRHSTKQLMVVQLDWYYSTAMVQTRLVRTPSPGRNSKNRHKPETLFGGSQPVTPEQYLEILENPRLHLTSRPHSPSNNHNKNHNNNKNGRRRSSRQHLGGSGSNGRRSS